MPDLHFKHHAILSTWQRLHNPQPASWEEWLLNPWWVESKHSCISAQKSSQEKGTEITLNLGMSEQKHWCHAVQGWIPLYGQLLIAPGSQRVQYFHQESLSRETPGCLTCIWDDIPLPWSESVLDKLLQREHPSGIKAASVHEEVYQ